jgi:hypothetical protein
MPITCSDLLQSAVFAPGGRVQRLVVRVAVEPFGPWT